MVIEKREDYPSEWATFTAISKLLGMSPETLRTWFRKTQVDTGARPGDENHGKSPESIIEIPHPVRAVVGH